MRYFVGFVLFLLALGAAPRSVSAQEAKEGAISEPNRQEPSSEPAGEEGSRSLEYGDPVSTPPNTKWGLDWSLVEETPDVQTAKIGLGVSAAVIAVGGVVFGVSFIELCILQEDCPEPSWHRPVRITGGVLMAGGAAGMIVSGILLGVRKRQERRVQETHYGRSRRVQWDLAGSRLVF